MTQTTVHQVGSESSDLVADGYDSFYAAWGQSPALCTIWREKVTGPDYPDEFAHISFLPLAQLEALADGLNLSRDEVLVDVACGAGGPGLWVATNTNVRVVGVDLSPVAVQVASARAVELGMGDRATFRQGSFSATGLETAAADALMSVDALQYAPDKAEALAEMARVVRAGGRLALVAFELDPDRIAGLPVWDDPIPDYRPLLDAAGFDLVSYDEMPNWREQIAAGFGAVVDQRDTLEVELGQSAAAAIVMEAAITLELQPYCGHVLAVAERRLS